MVPVNIQMVHLSVVRLAIVNALKAAGKSEEDIENTTYSKGMINKKDVERAMGAIVKMMEDENKTIDFWTGEEWVISKYFTKGFLCKLCANYLVNPYRCCHVSLRDHKKKMVGDKRTHWRDSHLTIPGEHSQFLEFIWFVFVSCLRVYL